VRSGSTSDYLTNDEIKSINLNTRELPNEPSSIRGRELLRYIPVVLSSDSRLIEPNRRDFLRVRYLSREDARKKEPRYRLTTKTLRTREQLIYGLKGQKLAIPNLTTCVFSGKIPIKAISISSTLHKNRYSCYFLLCSLVYAYVECVLKISFVLFARNTKGKKLSSVVSSRRKFSFFVVSQMWKFCSL